MKVFTYIILAISFSFSSCSSQKKLASNNSPVETAQATCQVWTGGRPEAGSGINLSIALKNTIPEDIEIQHVYFRGMVSDIKLLQVEDKNYLRANLTKGALSKPDIVMHKDAEKEVGNTPPQLNTKFPFELKQDECMISYLEGDIVKHFKVENIKEKAPLIYQ